MLEDSYLCEANIEAAQIKKDLDKELLKKKLDFIKKVCDECKEYEKKTFNN